MRAQTPKIEPQPHTSRSPKKRNRTNFVKRIVNAPREPRRGGRGNAY